MKWRIVCRPKLYGGLGMPDLQATNEALRVCWLWQSWTEPCKPWHGLPIPIDNKVRDLFAASGQFPPGGWPSAHVLD